MKRLVISSVVAVCVVCAVIMLLSRSGSSQSQISDCKEPFGNPPCKANNSATFNNGQNTGCKVEFHWLRCDGVSHGSVFDSCTNIGCKAVCSCSCATNGYGVSWQDTCEDIVKSESFSCNRCGAVPTPTPTPTPCFADGIACGGDFDCCSRICDQFNGVCVGDTPSEGGCSGCTEVTCPGQCFMGCCTQTPIVVDVLGDGFDLTSLAGGVRFDLNVNGPAEHLQSCLDLGWQR
jgi:hypothetical protein